MMEERRLPAGWPKDAQTYHRITINEVIDRFTRKQEHRFWSTEQQNAGGVPLVIRGIPRGAYQNSRAEDPNIEPDIVAGFIEEMGNLLHYAIEHPQDQRVLSLMNAASEANIEGLFKGRLAIYSHRLTFNVHEIEISNEYIIGNGCLNHLFGPTEKLKSAK